MMRPLPLVALLVLPAAAIAAGPLPLRTGTYVETETPCANAPFAAMRSYDGMGLADPHSRACRIKTVARHGARYVVDNNCIDAGAGPAPRSTERLSLTMQSPTRFSIGGTPFRWCAGRL